MKAVDNARIGVYCARVRIGATKGNLENRIAPGDELMTAQQAAERLRLSRRTVYLMMESGELAYIQVTARRRRIPESAVMGLLNRRLVVA